MERITEEQIFKTIDSEQVLDYTMKRYWNDEEVEDPETHEVSIQSTLTKTEKTLNDVDGTILEVVEGDGYMSQIQVYPVVEVVPQPPTLEERLAALEEAQLATIGL
jgi:hypothetical protein